jgi:Cupin
MSPDATAPLGVSIINGGATAAARRLGIAGCHSTSAASSARKASRSSAFHASTARWTVSTFSRDIARPASRGLLLLARSSGPRWASVACGECSGTGERVTTVLDFPSRDGLVVNAVRVDYEPGGFSRVHRHRAGAYVYVIDGSVIFGIDDRTNRSCLRRETRSTSRRAPSTQCERGAPGEHARRR